MYKESKAMKELREIRDMNYENTKNMNADEMIEYFRTKAQKAEMRIKDKIKV